MIRRVQRPGGSSWPCVLILVLAAACALVVPATGASPPARPSTGRHAPPPPPETQAPGARVFGAETSRWSIALGPGLATSGDLFRVVVPSQQVRTWSPPAGADFNAYEFLVTLDQDLAFGGTVSYRLTPRWLARVDLSWARLNATAEARVGQGVELHSWAQPAFLLAAAELECQLLHARAYPYALVGAAWTRLSAAEAPALEQSRLGLRAGVGFHYAFSPQWGVRAELRDTRQQFDLHAYGRAAEFGGQPFEQRGPQNLFEALVQVRVLM